MKIVHITATFPPYYAGTGNVCYHNARVLAARGHDVHIFTADYPGVQDDPSGVTVHRFKPLLRLGNAPLLPQLLKVGAFDVAHLHYPFIFGAEMVAASCLLRRVPLVITYHHDLVAHGWRGRLFSAYQRIATPSIIRSAKQICAVSMDHAASTRGIGDLLRNQPDRITEIPNGVDTTIFRPSMGGLMVRNRLGIPDDTFVTVFVGALDSAHYFKRVDLLLEAIATLPNLDVHALIIGDGDLRPKLESMAGDLGISHKTHFVGSVTQSELPPLLAAADVLVLPSDLESFGLVLVEAMACGRPVIATDLPGVRSVVADSVDGLLVPPGDAKALAAAMNLLADMGSDEIQAMRQAGRTKAKQRYDWNRIGHSLELIYARASESRRLVQQMTAASDQVESNELSVQARVAVGIIADRCGKNGTIVGQGIGQHFLLDELAAYGEIFEVNSRLVSLGANPEQTRKFVITQRPDRVISMTTGPLARPLGRFRGGMVDLPCDLPLKVWQSMGYEQVYEQGVNGIGSVSWAASERILKRVGRPDLADRSRVAMHRTFTASRHLNSLCTIAIREYRRIA